MQVNISVCIRKIAFNVLDILVHIPVYLHRPGELA